MRKLLIGKNEAGQRMDKYLKKYFREAGSGFLYKMLRKKNILLNDKKAEGREMLKEGDTVTLYLSEETIEKFRGHSEKREIVDTYPRTVLSILYEDADILILNKPAGVLSQKASDQDVSMVEYLIGYLLESGAITMEELATFRPSVCNRLDRNTSGIIVSGKTLPGLQVLSELLKERLVKKYYLCLVKGQVTKSRHCRGFLKKDSRTNQVRVLKKQEDGASYIETAYEPLWSSPKESLLKVELITGKSHQIRSHLASMGFPLAGDPKYGDLNWNRELKKMTGLHRQFLHAWQMEFPSVDGAGKGISGKTVYAPLPDDLANTLQWVGCPDSLFTEGNET